MSTEQNAQEDIVSDCVQGGANPAPRDTADRADKPEHASTTTDHRGDERAPKAPGTAEEENSKSGDDRGLTTDASLSD